MAVSTLLADLAGNMVSSPVLLALLMAALASVSWVQDDDAEADEASDSDSESFSDGTVATAAICQSPVKQVSKETAAHEESEYRFAPVTPPGSLTPIHPMLRTPRPHITRLSQASTGANSSTSKEGV